MGDVNGTCVLEVRAGQSSVPLRELRPGETMDPTSIGRAAMWAVDAPGILDVHAFVYFDGRALFLQSADPSNPARGNGQAIGGTWQQVEIPCTIELGRARLVYRTLEETDDEDKTVARPIEELMAPPGGGGGGGMQFRPGAGLLANRQDEEERTRFSPMDFPGPGAPGPGRQPEPTVVSPLESPGPGGGPRPAAGAPAAWGDAPGQGSTNVGAPVPAASSGAYQQQWDPQQGGMMQPGMMQSGMQPGMMQPGMMQPGMMQPGMMQPGMMQPGMMQPGMMQPGMMQPGMMQPGMMQPGMMQPGMMQPGMMPGAETGKVAAAGPQTFMERVKQDWEQTSFIKKGMLFATPLVALMAMQAFQEPEPLPEEPTGPATTSTATPSTSGSGAHAAPPGDGGGGAGGGTPPAVEPLGVLFPQTPPAADAGAPKPPKKPASPTLEREAADAIALGNYAKAAQLYDQLAVAHPEKAQLYKTAAKVARAKAGVP